MKGSVATLSKQIQDYRDLANREHQRCVVRAADLDIFVGNILQQKQRLDAQIGQLEADLAAATKDQQLSQAEIARLTGQIGQVRAAFMERQRKLEELRRWWWVPGYGQYLAIRTLVDDDIGNERQFANTLDDTMRMMKSTQEAYGAAENTRRQLIAERERVTKTADALPHMRDEVVRRIKGARATTVFLADAEVFWGKMQTALDFKVESSRDDLALLQALLSKEALPVLRAEYDAQAMTLKDALFAFARSVDTKSNFLLDKSADFCGGPPLTSESLAVNTPKRCNISSITKYYEIVDPATCSFRYLNPPGCPPLAKSVDMSAESVDRGRSRGAWTRSPGQNWVGRPGTSPCAVDGTIYYGKLSGPDQCEATCQGDSDCTAWTFNTNNGFMPNSVGQCWGGPRPLALNKRDWSGFVSGGIR